MLGLDNFNFSPTVIFVLDPLLLTILAAFPIYKWVVRPLLTELEVNLEDQVKETRSVIDNAVDGVVSIDEKRNIFRFNPAAEKLFGYQASEVFGRNIKILMPDSVGNKHDEYMSNYKKTGVTNIFGMGREFVGLRKDGTEFALHLSINKTDLHKSKTFTGVMRDLTDEKKEFLLLEEKNKALEDQRLKLEAQNAIIEQSAIEQVHLLDDLANATYDIENKNIILQEIMNNTGQGIVVYSKFLKITAWNDTFKELMGLQDREYKEGMSLEEFFDLNIKDGHDYEQTIPEYIDALKDRIAGREECSFYSWDRERAGVILNTAQRILADGSVINTYNDVTEERLKEKLTAELANKDGLTGLANRRAFDAQLDEEVSKFHEQQIPFLLAYLDLDNFKSLNDTQGHNAGDVALKMVADILTKKMRKHDIPVRLGGDEFAIIFRDTTNVDIAVERLEAIIAEIKNTNKLGDYIINIGASVGIARCPADANDVKELKELVDSALYKAKGKGKGIVCLASE